MKLELSGEEGKIIVEILKYSVDYCPIESISDKVEISVDKVQNLASKLEAALASPQ